MLPHQRGVGKWGQGTPGRGLQWLVWSEESRPLCKAMLWQSSGGSTMSQRQKEECLLDRQGLNRRAQGRLRLSRRA